MTRAELVHEERVRAAYADVVARLRRDPSYGATVPTSLEVHAVLSQWLVGSTVNEVRGACVRYSLALSDWPDR